MGRSHRRSASVFDPGATQLFARSTKSHPSASDTSSPRSHEHDVPETTQNPVIRFQTANSAPGPPCQCGQFVGGLAYAVAEV